MKQLSPVMMLLLFSLGCGGYGSGMGTTPAPTPQIAPASGGYSTPLTITITDSLQNAVIYVTTDGSTPTLSSPLYRGPIMLSQAGQVQVRAIVAVANFTLQ
jgi:Chitobiase/beta-hexosaminidase C-terminal domain